MKNNELYFKFKLSSYESVTENGFDNSKVIADKLLNGQGINCYVHIYDNARCKGNCIDFGRITDIFSF